jgi:hypothetical protein
MPLIEYDEEEKMKLVNKILVIGIMTVQSVFSVIGAHAVYDEIIAHKANIYLEVDGVTIKCENPFVTIDDTVYVPLRETFESLGCYVDWRRSSVAVYTKDLYEEYESNGYTYHFINDDIPISKARLETDCLKPITEDRIVPEGEKITDLNTVQGAATDFSEIIEKTDGFQYKFFKNNKMKYFEFYSIEDTWLIMPQSKTVDIEDGWKYCYTIDKTTGEVDEYRYISRWKFSYYLYAYINNITDTDD